MRYVMPLGLIALLAFAAPARAQKLQLSLIARSEARPDRDATATALYEAVRKGLEALPDVELVPSDGSRRIVWILVGATPGQTAASVMVTERYDRETLMVLGIEDDDMAHRMMALQIVADHQIFTGKSVQDLARRIVAAIDRGALDRVRKLPRGN
ncbi:MAG TPA: hypothetical protein VKD69_00510 [Vicinamibacterales bacterium]|nr:hypothetical protein [Vicinamibacterales bacterium]